MKIQSPTFTDYYIPYYAPRSFPTIEKVARHILNEALDGKKVIIYKNESVARAIAKKQNDGDGYADCFTVSVSNPHGWGVFIKSDKDLIGIRCSDKVRLYLDIH